VRFSFFSIGGRFVVGADDPIDPHRRDSQEHGDIRFGVQVTGWRIDVRQMQVEWLLGRWCSGARF